MSLADRSPDLRPTAWRLRLPTLAGSGFVQSENGRLQLRGSGGFSPRFPCIAPANYFFNTTSLTHCSLNRNTYLCTPNRNTDGTAGVIEMTQQSARGIEETLLRRNSRIVIDLPSRSTRIDVNPVGLLARVSLDGSCLPSALLRQWLSRFNPPRLQWRGRSGFAPDSHTTPSLKIYTQREEIRQVR